MLIDEDKVLIGYIFDEPIIDFSVWLGRYENDIGFLSKLSDSVFLRPKLVENLKRSLPRPPSLRLQLSLQSISDAPI